MNDFSSIKNDINRYQFACASMEILNSFMRSHVQDKNIFKLTVKFLSYLNNDKITNYYIIFLKFLALFCKLNGHFPNFKECANWERVKSCTLF